MEDEELFDELAERIAEGPIVFIADDEWIEKLNDDEVPS